MGFKQFFEGYADKIQKEIYNELKKKVKDGVFFFDERIFEEDAEKEYTMNVAGSNIKVFLVKARGKDTFKFNYTYV